MSKVISRIDTPSRTYMGMRCVLDTVGNQIIHVGVRRFKVHLETKRPASFFVKAELHLFKDLQISLNRGITISSWQNICRRNGKFCIRILALILGLSAIDGEFSLHCHFVLGHITAVGQSLLNQFNRKSVKLIKVFTAVGGSFWSPS